MLAELCLECKNWFTLDEDKHSEMFTIESGMITPFSFVAENQYFRIIGSRFNDGVYKNSSEVLAALIPEKFEGQIWAMRVPPAFIALDREIEDFNQKMSGISSPYTSESWGGYSYSIATGASGGAITWQEAFAAKLRKWRKM